MKCSCGYQFDKSEKESEDNKPFIRIRCKVEGTKFGHTSFRKMTKEGYEETGYLFSCPKCGAVKISDSYLGV